MRILMVCLGNICRSPLAEGILKLKVRQNNLDWKVDSAGTSGWHEGDLPDKRSIEIAAKNGLDITDQRSRKFVRADFEDFDLILAMDSSNYQNILALAQNESDKDKVKLILNYAYPDQNRAVPDPYYDNGFPRVYTMLEKACQDIVQTYV
ncbi:MAG: low molecular weight phosphotyrosine protein phosphatase [Saprospiraceae bacterium]|nr:low molecular weight phosphotyrosine protein phosphatase [Saprospiraceae bacterium]